MQVEQIYGQSSGLKYTFGELDDTAVQDGTNRLSKVSTDLILPDQSADDKLSSIILPANRIIKKESPRMTYKQRKKYHQKKKLGQLAKAYF